jgi:2-methylfumaryl-CoA hydratase
MRPATGYFFDDYHVGQKFAHATPRTITQGDAALYQALIGSRNPLHCSEPFAQALGYPSMPVDDLLVFHIAFGKTVPDISYNAVANLGYADCRFVKPVFIGDTLQAETEIVGMKANSSGKTGVVYVRSNCLNQRDELVLTWVRWVMVHRAHQAPRKADAPNSLSGAGFQAAPTFDEVVPVTALSIPKWKIEAASISHATSATGSDVFWDDINLNQSIHHPAGMTIDETDHTLATKLYQNTARVHFDLHHMKDSRFGRRLIYGGQIISICRALSFDGLENALTIAAINSGSHLNPTFAGDTIYAASLPLMKWAINDQVGALRLQLDGYKNTSPDEPEFGRLDSPQHVLSLDYTVLMPRRT